MTRKRTGNLKPSGEASKSLSLSLQRPKPPQSLVCVLLQNPFLIFFFFFLRYSSISQKNILKAKTTARLGDDNQQSLGLSFIMIYFFPWFLLD